MDRIESHDRNTDTEQIVTHLNWFQAILDWVGESCFCDPFSEHVGNRKENCLINSFLTMHGT